jgi:hypothetical protein
MKFQTKKTIAIVLAVLLSTTLLVSMASAKTPTSDLPTRSKVLEFVKNYQYESGFVDTVSSDSKVIYPWWPWDTWKDKYKNKYISFYYKISDKKYQSIYFDDFGHIISPKGMNLKLVERYPGE